MNGFNFVVFPRGFKNSASSSTLEIVGKIAQMDCCNVCVRMRRRCSMFVTVNVGVMLRHVTSWYVTLRHYVNTKYEFTAAACMSESDMQCANAQPSIKCGSICRQ